MSDTTFSSLELSAPLLAALADVGYETPSPIQEACIPPLLAGHDLLGEAQTGTGKTAAFALPFLQRLDLELMQPQVLVLTPTRELAIQVAEAFQRYARHLPGFHVLPVYGGQGMGLQLRSLKRGVHVIVGTPGRVMDHLERKSLVLDQLTGLVLDEADEMLRMGFIDDVQWILEHTPATRQTALFSATMSDTIRRVARTHMREPREIKIKSATRTVAAIRQRYWQVTGTNKLDALTRILEVEEELDAALVFVRTKTATVELADRLEARGYSAAALNGDMNQPLRERVIEQLKSGALDIVVATDVAARGIDVGRISHVINYDIPYDSEAYVHRIGRTGRAGRTGNAILFVAPREFRMLRTIERVTRQPIEPLTLPSRALVADRRVAQFRKQVAEVLKSEPMEFFAEVVAQLEQEHEGNLAAVAAALVCMAQRAKPLRLQEKEGYGSDGGESRERTPARVARDDRDPRDGRGTRAPREEREPRERKTRAAAPAIEPRGALVPFRIEVGRDHEASPREIVGAIANEAGLASRFIGRIELFDQYSTVELPADLPAAVLDVLRRTRVKQRALEIRPMAAGETDQRPGRGKSERKRPPRRERDERTGHQPPRKVAREPAPKVPSPRPRGAKREKP
ncbi:MAG: DEAD/DEAH box helicase [Gammaproteobacteria bacterium]|jgi:ATP-dependent RNA helicase DeaD|nr:DEAD/DEAH box helicase [Gammaproteobacteria bacterium]MBP6052943.1 DEAD/DEAH box helicase [Pseudomonadales bacterium]MBK6583963.1 DEAD/DEAH box helicase [Gammaproteobacteria bacterium]MBK7169326.1 DEAD/DEAH box helicase [Gammaproteobacteria bacterium]MBK7522468.1 DEAD/DEAH box helicase [Gammaproteobacteria bacterium]